MGSKALKKIAKIAGPIVGGAVGGPAGAAVGGALGGAIGGGGLKGALIGAGTGYAGNVLGSSIGSSLTSNLGKIGGTSLGSLSSNTLGPYAAGGIGKIAGNSIGSAIANTTVGGALGGFAGNSIAGSVADSLGLGEQPEMSKPKTQTESPFAPSRNAQLDLPGSLTGLNGLDDVQQSTNLANQGVYGGGLGKDEQTYFTNLLNRRLVDDAGNVDSDLSEVNPIEQSYLSQIGLGGYQDSKSLLEALNKWKAV